MGRTGRAALLAGLIGFVAVAGLGAFLVPDATVPAVIAGVVVGALSALLIVAAARRAESFERPAPVKPRHPGEPEPADGGTTASTPDPDRPDSDEDDRV